MKKSINLPFTNELKGGNKKSFKIMNDEQLVNRSKKNISILNIIKKFVHIDNNLNNSNKINYVNASNTKEYYKKLNKK
jgi:hypothetical protein